MIKDSEYYSVNFIPYRKIGKHHNGDIILLCMLDNMKYLIENNIKMYDRFNSSIIESINESDVSKLQKLFK